VSKNAIDLARQRKVPFRVNRGQVINKSVTVNDSNGSFDFADHTAEMYVYNSYSKTDTPEFTVTVTLSPGEMNFSHAAITRKREGLIYQLWITDNDGYRQPWLNGPFLVLNSEVDFNSESDTIVISPNGDDITLSINVGNSFVKSIGTELTSSQILNLHTTPVQYLVPISSNKYAVPISCDYVHVFGGVPYTRNSVAQVTHYYDAVTSVGLGAGAMLTTSFDSVSNQFSVGPLASTNTNLILDKGLFVKLNTGSFTLGNGTLKIKVLYHVVTV
jgi:hypothetical protein